MDIIFSLSVCVATVPEAGVDGQAASEPTSRRVQRGGVPSAGQRLRHPPKAVAACSRDIEWPTVKRLIEGIEVPDAIIAANDDMAAAALWLAHQRRICMPDDLAITGFDDTLIATRVWPPLTTVHQPIGDMASRAIESITRAIRATDHRGVAEDVVLPHAIIERLSA